MKLVLATNNKGKVKELDQLLKPLGFEVVPIGQYPGFQEVEEDGDTFEANAIKKAVAAAEFTGELALADDSGLEVDALKGAPGVHSARFAGEPKDDQRNNNKLLQLMEGVPEKERTGRFRCVIAVSTPDGKTQTADGACQGLILREMKGIGGFGYDPLFYVTEFKKTFAELDLTTKNLISHRGKALQRAKEILDRLRTVQEG
ncbi:XTP/dITP diphosphatase [Desulforamulus aquiferis]|uniref:dITP/XTP pyrophosphatase n=1 Tax=Desulforamulus aquiferis TaxID=1397668 RepID=A0AAW7ZA87_9FIRM|nr:XTP/dITP diphosphatase [Desulforamulus aquiferis]MDO7786325.1 XTP/dITP diphosphatase [Desulforamulus aquiferis]RYD06170.1 deoxyribonucleotide triphosphate pyrophosphatase [Desulforamulus aquiferis]